MSDSFTPEDVSRRLGQIEHLLGQVLDRQERNTVKTRLSIERSIEKVGLDLSSHRELVEGASFYSSERIEEKDLENRLFERGRQGWEMAGLSLIPTLQDSYLVVFRQSMYSDGAVESGK